VQGANGKPILVAIVWRDIIRRDVLEPHGR
jgi:hypothetical protein